MAGGTVSEGALTGLSEAEASSRLEVEGYNELPRAKARGLGAILLELLREPMLSLLLVAAAVYLLVGDLEEALLLIASMGFIIALTVYQERRTERALDALRDLASPRALVVRDGVQRRVPGREVARGDLVLLEEGDRVPADGVMVGGEHLAVDESLLTGESVPVDKQPAGGELALQPPGEQQSSSVYSGTLVVSGHALVRVMATGPRSELARIGHSLAAVQTERTPLQRESGRLVRVLATVAVVLSLVAAAGQTLVTGDPVEGVLAGVTLAMAIIPEEFPIVLTVFLALGAWRMTEQHVLTRRMPALETLGATTVLCVDKTGTLTLNQMSVHALATSEGRVDVRDSDASALPQPARQVLLHGALASQSEPVDPMERAIVRLTAEAGSEQADTAARRLVREYPLTPRLLAITRVWGSEGAEPLLVATKGAPEVVADLCRLAGTERSQVLEMMDGMARDGLRVLGVARAGWQADALPETVQEFPFEWLGLVGLADPVRPEVPDAVEECYSAGIRVIMITGDYPVTAQSIARAAGLRSPEAVLTGADLRAMDGPQLAERLGSVDVFARVAPEQKLQLVQALKQRGHVVAMTGDGVNDAPALKAADIGVAMGLRGTDVAREAAALVLLDDAFDSIVAAVRQGRRIYDNLKKALGFIISVHVPIAGISLIPILFGLPLVMMPAHVVFLELIIDPACSLAFEAERAAPDVMRRPPRNPRERFFPARLLAAAAARGLSGLGGVLTVFLVALASGRSDDEARTLAFVALVIVALMLILANRSADYARGRWGGHNRAASWVTAGTLVALALLLAVPSLRSLFQFAPVTLLEAGLAALTGALSVLVVELARVVLAARRAAASR